MKEPIILWQDQPEAHDYPAAESYLTLHVGPVEAKTLVKALKAANVVPFKAKDIFRASNLSLLGVSNSHVKKDRKKIRAGEKISPLLLVATDNKVVIADGYHRLCAIYGFNEDATIMAKLVVG